MNVTFVATFEERKRNNEEVKNLIGLLEIGLISWDQCKYLIDFKNSNLRSTEFKQQKKKN